MGALEYIHHASLNQDLVSDQILPLESRIIYGMGNMVDGTDGDAVTSPHFMASKSCRL